MRNYLNLVEKIIHEGVDREDRTGTGTRSIFGEQLRFDLENNFPLITTKKVHLKSIIYELLWFIKGETNIKYLKDNAWQFFEDCRGKDIHQYIWSLSNDVIMKRVPEEVEQ